MRNLLPNTPPKNPIDNDETDTDRLAAICEPLLVALMDNLGRLFFLVVFFARKQGCCHHRTGANLLLRDGSDAPLAGHDGGQAWWPVLRDAQGGRGLHDDEAADYYF